MEIRKPTKRELAFRYIRAFIALMAIAGLLYISGIYQSLLYRRTPASVTQRKVESMLDAEIIIVPLRVFVFVNNESGSERSKEDVERLIGNASKIWGQAQIELSTEKIVFLESSGREIEAFLNNPRVFTVNLEDYNDRRINVFLKESLGKLNGIAFIGLGVVAVADFTTSNDFRVLGHEIGHILGLNHAPSDKRRLMSQGSGGFKLTLEEIMRARQATLNFVLE